MKTWLRIGIWCVTFGIGVLSPVSPAFAQSATEACARKAVAALKAYSPSGYDSWLRSRGKDTFNETLDGCDDADVFYEQGIATAVHETNHRIRSESGAYHLVSGEMLAAPSDAGLYEPSEMAATLKAQAGISDEDDNFTTYVALGDGTQEASSKSHFSYLLDELNAYTNDLQVSVDFDAARLHKMGYRQRGVPALLTYVAFYATYARAREVKSWNAMANDPNLRGVLRKLWDQAETTLDAGCKRQQMSDDDNYIRFLCDPRQTAATAALIGRSDLCPQACPQISMQEQVGPDVEITVGPTKRTIVEFGK